MGLQTVNYLFLISGTENSFRALFPRRPIQIGRLGNNSFENVLNMSENFVSRGSTQSSPFVIIISYYITKIMVQHNIYFPVILVSNQQFIVQNSQNSTDGHLFNNQIASLHSLLSAVHINNLVNNMFKLLLVLLQSFRAYIISLIAIGLKFEYFGIDWQLLCEQQYSY